MSERTTIETEIEQLNILSKKMGYDFKFESGTTDGKLYIAVFSKGQLTAFASGKTVSEILAMMLFNRLYIY